MEQIPIITAVLLMLGCGMLIIALLDGWSPGKRRRERRRRDRERTLPMHERLALAEEREAERQIDHGNPAFAAEHFRAAREYREEFHRAVMNGEEPKL